MRKKILTVLFAIACNSLFSQSIRLGINFPFKGPEHASIDTYMSQLQECGAQIYRQMTYADVIWRHIEPTDNNWNFQYPDSVFFNYPDYEYVANLYSVSVANADNGNVGYQVPWKACSGSPACGWKYEKDSIATIDYLTTCINRYSDEVKYWELGNESLGSNYPLGMPILSFVDFVKHNHRWIKAANPQAKVLLPGTVGTYGFPMQNTYNNLRALFSKNIENYFDILSFHDYNAWWTTPAHIDSIIGIMSSYNLDSKEIWITESGVSSLNFSPITPNYSSTDEQAADVWRRSTIAWAKGINAFFWHGGWSSGPPGEWAEFGILDQVGKKKKSYHSYQLLAQKIIGFSTAQIESMGVVDENNTSTTGGNGAWVVRFVVNGENKYVMWSRNHQTFSLTPVSNTKYSITHVVPTSISSNGETAIFSKDSVYVSTGNTVIFNLNSFPILVEETTLTSTSHLEEANSIKIFPNPAKSHFEINNTANIPCQIDLFDALGRLVLSIELKPLQTHKVDTTGLSKGIYMYRTGNSEGRLQHGRIVIK